MVGTIGKYGNCGWLLLGLVGVVDNGGKRASFSISVVIIGSVFLRGVKFDVCKYFLFCNLIRYTMLLILPYECLWLRFGTNFFCCKIAKHWLGVEIGLVFAIALRLWLKAYRSATVLSGAWLCLKFRQMLQKKNSFTWTLYTYMFFRIIEFSGIGRFTWPLTRQFAPPVSIRHLKYITPVFDVWYIWYT